MKQSFFQSVSQTDLGKRWWKARCLMFQLTEHKYFETFVIVMILLSSMALVSHQ
jgi:hypothetical protein